MKAHLKGLLAAGIFMLLFSVEASAQEIVILEQVTSTKDYTTIDLVRMDPRLSTFAHLVALADMNEQFENAGPHTLFVPTNAAFENMKVKSYLKLVDPDNKEDLIKFIEYYYLPKKVKKYDFKDDDVLQLGFNEGIDVSVDRDNNDMVTIGAAEIIQADIEGSNGILDIVDAVFEPSHNMLGN